MPLDEKSLQDLIVVVTRIETKLDTLIGGHEDHEARIRTLEGIPNTTKDHETRIRKLERLMYVSAGAGLLSGGAAGAALNAFLGG